MRDDEIMGAHAREADCARQSREHTRQFYSHGAHIGIHRPCVFPAERMQLGDEGRGTGAFIHTLLRT